MEERRDATDEEIENLPHTVDSIPSVVWIALSCSAAERFTYYAVSAPWQNYMQHESNEGAIPGALGLGQATATTISSAFLFFTFLAPVPFAILSDTWLGRYKTLCLSLCLDFGGCLALFVTSLPFVTTESNKVAGLALGMVFLGLGTGGVKATISPFIGDQYAVVRPQFVRRKNGTQHIADRTLTLQYIFNVNYWFTNIASLSLIASTSLERSVGFWAAYVLPLCTIWTALPLLVFWYKPIVKLSPQGNVLPRAGEVIMHSIRGRFTLAAARPSFQIEKYGRAVEWDDLFVDEIRRGLNAGKVVLCFLPFHLCMGQIMNNLISQAGQMKLGFLPNDTTPALNSTFCILLGPVIQKGLYPFLRGHGIVFRPIARMTTAFVLMGAAMGFAAGVQKLIYSRGPCYTHPLECPGSQNGTIPNDITVWVQAPVYFLLSFAEILGFPTVSEYSYSEAPTNMRSLIQALSQVSAGLGAAVGIALSSLSVDPKLLYLYTGLAVVMIISAIMFSVAFRHYDRMHAS